MSQSWYGWAPQQPFYQRAGADKHYAPWKKGNGRGAGALAKGQHKGHGKSEKKEWDQTWPETSKFPKYDQLKAGAQQIIEVHSETASGSAEDGLVRELQRCVNVARKAEQKVTALQKQIQTKQAQWEAFQTELKQSFLKEQQRFTQDLHRLRSELVAAEESQSEARAVVRCAARGEGLLPRQSQLEAEEQWQSKIRAWEQEGQLEEDAPGDAVLRRALEAAVTKPVQQDMRTPLRPTSLGMPSPGTKKEHQMAKTSATSPGQFRTGSAMGYVAVPGDASQLLPPFMGGSPSATCASADPYMDTPGVSNVAPIAKSVAKHIRKPPSTSPDGGHRTAIKERYRPKMPAHGSSPGLSLAEKLEAKRLAAGNATPDVKGGRSDAQMAATASAFLPADPPISGQRMGNANGPPPQAFIMYDAEDTATGEGQDQDHISDMEAWYQDYASGPPLTCGSRTKESLQDLE